MRWRRAAAHTLKSAMTLELTQNRGLWLQKYLLDEETSVITRRGKARGVAYDDYPLTSGCTSAFLCVRFRKTKLYIAALRRLRIHFHFDYGAEYFSGLHQPRDPLFLITDNGRCFTFGKRNEEKINQASLFSFPLRVSEVVIYSQQHHVAHLNVTGKKKLSRGNEHETVQYHYLLLTLTSHPAAIA